MGSSASHINSNCRPAQYIDVQIMFLARSDDFSRLGAETTEVVTTDSKSFSEKL
jgi:hypothetical protein